MADFIDTPRPISGSIKGFGVAKMLNVQIGTIQWSWEDDQGMVHDHTIPNSYYIPDGQVQLLSPQHWMQKTMSKQEWCKHSHSCITKHDHIQLTWKEKFKWMVPLDSSNVGTFTLTPGYNHFAVFATETHIIPKEEDDHPILLTKGGNMQILSASWTTMSHCSRNIQSKSTLTCKDHHHPSSSSLMNWWKLSQQMPLPSSFAIISNMGMSHPRRFKPWPSRASTPGEWGIVS